MTALICMTASFFGDVFNNFLIIDATDRRKIRSNQKRLFIAVAYTPFHFSRTLPLSSLYCTIYNIFVLLCVLEFSDWLCNSADRSLYNFAFDVLNIEFVFLGKIKTQQENRITGTFKDCGFIFDLPVIRFQKLLVL